MELMELTSKNYLMNMMTYPEELTPEIDEVLGWSFVDCSQRAEIMRRAGYDIPRKMEREGAFVRHYLLKFVLQHGANWRDAAKLDWQRIVALLPPTPTASPDAEAAR